MTKKLSEYEVQKQKKKQLLVRNEFLYQNQSVEKANINGRLLKDIWDEVTFAGFMSCLG